VVIPSLEFQAHSHEVKGMPPCGRCTDGDDEHTRHIKTIARTRGGRVLSALTPHSFEYAEGAYAVNERREPIDDYLTDECAPPHTRCRRQRATLGRHTGEI